MAIKTEVKSNLISILEKEMKVRGYTNSELAKKLNKSDPSSITAWIAGTYKPSAKTVKDMRKLGFSLTACLSPSEMVPIKDPIEK